MASWSPSSYLRFADERSRPFYDLTARIDAVSPTTVVDLGCGPGQLTASLADRWPSARIHGVDSSAAMVDAASAHAGDRVEFTRADLADWRPPVPADVVVSNATLQWVPHHRSLLPGLLERLAPGGWLAFQVPGNFDEPSHTLLHDLASDPRFAAATRGVERPAAFDAATYLSDLTALGCRVDAWETTYLHVLTGPDPVFRWISGTGARPVLQALDVRQREQFETEYKAALRAAYPQRPELGEGDGGGTVLPFRRVFVVAQRPS
jgi:trans-aconitate 2-methyltransferase